MFRKIKYFKDFLGGGEGFTIYGTLGSTHKLCPYMGWEGLQPISDEAMSRVVMAGTKGRLPQAP